jgi:hypothetical protein
VQLGQREAGEDVARKQREFDSTSPVGPLPGQLHRRQQGRQLPFEQEPGDALLRARSRVARVPARGEVMASECGVPACAVRAGTCRAEVGGWHCVLARAGAGGLIARSNAPACGRGPGATGTASRGQDKSARTQLPGKAGMRRG